MIKRIVNEKPNPCCRYCWDTSIRIKKNSYRVTCSCIFTQKQKWIKKNNKWKIDSSRSYPIDMIQSTLFDYILTKK